MEPFPGVEPGGLSIPRTSARRREGRGSGSRTRTCVRWIQRPAGMPATHPGAEPSPGADPGLTPYRGAVTAVCDGGVSPVRFERTLPSASGWCLLPLGYEDMEPPSGVEPDHPPYEGGAAAVRGGIASGAGLEPAWAGFRVLLGGQHPTRKWCARWESNPHPPVFGTGRSAGWLYPRLVRRLGFEPRAP